MDFKTPKMQNITDTAVLAGGAVGGALASNYIVAQFIGDEKEKKAKAEKDGKPLKDEDLKKNRQLTKAIVLVACVVGASAVQGNDTTANIARSAFLGASVAQGVSFLRDVMTIKEDDKAIKKALGLGCPCENGLGEPDYFDYRPAYYDYSPQVYVEPEPSKNLLMDFSPKKNYS